MTKLSNTIRNATAVLLAAGFIPGALWAQDNASTNQDKLAAASTVAAVQRASREACEQAKKDAWFKRQMQLTDGDVDPFVQLPIRADCGGDGDGGKGDAHRVANTTSYSK